MTDGNELESCEKSVCGHEVAGKFPTNLKQHLKKQHPVQYQAVLEKEKDKTKRAAKSRPPKVACSQTTIDESFLGKRASPYSCDSAQYKHITEKLAIFVRSTNVPIRLVENAEFKSLMGGSTSSPMSSTRKQALGCF